MLRRRPCGCSAGLCQATPSHTLLSSTSPSSTTSRSPNRTGRTKFIISPLMVKLRRTPGCSSTISQSMLPFLSVHSGLVFVASVRHQLVFHLPHAVQSKRFHENDDVHTVSGCEIAMFAVRLVPWAGTPVPTPLPTGKLPCRRATIEGICTEPGELASQCCGVPAFKYILKP